MEQDPKPALICRCGHSAKDHESRSIANDLSVCTHDGCSCKEIVPREPVARKQVPSRFSAAVFQRIVAGIYMVPVAQLTSDSNVREHVFPRHLSMYVVRLHTRMSYPAIGAWFHRDPTSVMYAVRRLEMLRSCFPHVNSTIHTIEAKLDLDQTDPLWRQY